MEEEILQNRLKKVNSLQIKWLHNFGFDRRAPNKFYQAASIIADIQKRQLRALSLDLGASFDKLKKDL